MEDIFFISSCMNDFSDGSAWWAPLYVNGIGLHIITYGAATYIEVHISNVVDGPHRCRKPRLAHSLLSFGWIPRKGMKLESHGVHVFTTVFHLGAKREPPGFLQRTPPSTGHSCRSPHQRHLIRVDWLLSDYPIPSMYAMGICNYCWK